VACLTAVILVARVIHTDLNVTQHLTGARRANYGTEPADAGVEITRRSYNDVLARRSNFRAECDRQDDCFASPPRRNMMPLNLSQWGRGSAARLLAVGNQDGSHLPGREQAIRRVIRTFNPWRFHELRRLVSSTTSTPRVMINLELFHIKREELHRQWRRDQLQSTG